MSDLLAAFLYAQLENMEQINNRREEIFDYYYKALMSLANDGKLRLTYVSTECQSNSHLFYIILQDEPTRNGLMDYLKSQGILAIFHYVPLHLSSVGRPMGYREGQLTETEYISGRLLSLPFFYEIKQEEQEEVVRAIKEYFQKSRG